MNIDEMTPKQLGIAAAGEVMGWHQWDYEPIDFFVRDYDGPWPVFLSDLPDWLCVYEEGHVLGKRWAPWKDMNDVWEVVEELRRGAAGHAAACISINLYDDVRQPDTEVIIFAPDIAKVEAWDSNVCLAILRAALKAVEGTDGQR